MSAPPKISIVTATFNSVATLTDTLRSLAQQSYPHTELLIIDGGSTDGTQELVIQQFDNLVDVLISEADQGIYDALNKGILAASGDIIGLLHSDDVLAAPDIIEAVANIFQADAAVDAVYGDLIYVKKQMPHAIVRRWQSKPFNPSLLKQGWMPPHPTLYLRKRVFENAGLFDTSYKIAADYEHILRVFSKPGIVSCYLPRVMVKMKTGGASNRSVSNIIQKSREDYNAMQRHEIGGIGALLMKNLSKFSQFRLTQKS